MSQSHKNISDKVTKNYFEMKHSNAVLLENLNIQFLNQHVQTAHSALTFIHSVIIVKDNKVALFKKNKDEKDFSKIEEEIIAPDFEGYNQVKQISHIPLLLINLLQDKKLTEAQQNIKLKDLHRNLVDINNDIEASNKTNIHQKTILMHSIQFILIILAKRASLDIQQTISAYLMGIKKSLEYNKLFVTDTQLSRLNEITYAWIKKGLDLNTARVILVTPHGPRPNRIEFQYYLDLFAKHGISAAENDRVYHVEQLPQHIKIITDHDLIQDFLAVSERNKMIGKIFNHNPKMMFKDILAEKAPQVLSTLSRPNNFILFQASPLVKNTCAVAEHQQVLISRL